MGMRVAKAKKVKGRDLRPGMRFSTMQGAHGKIKSIETQEDGSLTIEFEGGCIWPEGGWTRGPVSGFGTDEEFWVR